MKIQPKIYKKYIPCNTPPGGLCGMISWYKTEMKIFTKSKVAKAYAKFVLYLCRYFLN